VTRPGPRTTRTVAEVAALYSNFLVRVPRVAIDVCDVCHGAVDPAYSRCFQCFDSIRKLGSGTADVVSFVSLAPTGGQMAQELYTYKRSSVPERYRLPRLIGLSAGLWQWLAKHEACMAGRVGGSQFDVITTVPSTSGRIGQHPLGQLVAGVVTNSSDRYQSLLAVQRTDLEQRECAVDRYAVTGDAHRASILVIDDTWTTGAHAQSASAALKQAGAISVGLLAIGRWLTVDYQNNRAWLSVHRTMGWDWDRCCLEL